MNGILVLSILLILFFLGPVITYTWFWYETVNTPHDERLRELFKGSRLRWMAAGICQASLSQILVVLSYPWGLWQNLRFPEPDRTCTLPTLILVHGLYHNRSAWVLYRLWLRRAGFKNIYAIQYSSWNTCFEDVLGRVEKLVDQLAQRFPERQAVLIGHSLGGLLCRAYVDYLGKSERIAAVITLGTPHQGSKLALLGVGKLARDLSFRGPVILELEGRSSNSSIPHLAIYSPLDNMVLPASALKPPQPGWEWRESLPVSHVGMLFHRPTAMQVADYLAGLSKSAGAACSTGSPHMTRPRATRN